MDPTKRLGAIESAILRHAWVADGCNDAYKYVLECEGNTENIEDEIRRRRDTIAASGETGGMAPRASPRIYLDSYLATLEDALRLMKKMKAEGYTWN